MSLSPDPINGKLAFGGCSASASISGLLDACAFLFPAV
jgi:hypothetical protein